MEKKDIYIGLGVLALLGGGYWYYSKKKAADALKATPTQKTTFALPGGGQTSVTVPTMYVCNTGDFCRLLPGAVGDVAAKLQSFKLERTSEGSVGSHTILDGPGEVAATIYEITAQGTGPAFAEEFAQLLGRGLALFMLKGVFGVWAQGASIDGVQIFAVPVDAAKAANKAIFNDYVLVGGPL